MCKHVYEKVKSLLNDGAGRVYVWQQPRQACGYNRKIFTVSTEPDPPASQFRLLGCINRETEKTSFFVSFGNRVETDSPSPSPQWPSSASVCG